MEILGAIVAGSCKWCCGLLCTEIRYVTTFKDSCNNLTREMKQLINQRDAVNETIQAADFRKVPIRSVEQWLKEVEEMETKVSSITEAIGSRSDTGIHPTCCYCYNWRLRYKFSKKAAKVIDDIKVLKEVGKFERGVVTDFPRQGVVELPTPTILDGSKAQGLKDEIMGWLRDGGIGSIGVWGMGGVGKTTLLKNVNNLLKEETTREPLFAVAIWVTVSKDLSLRQIQSVIARRLNIPLSSDPNGEESMAFDLFNGLKRVKRFLLILDDVWERVDLDKVGVPRRNRHSGSTILLTTRSLNVCREMMVEKEVKVGTLDEEEAWRLFRENAGSVVDLQDIRPLAHAVSTECHCLPLALVTVGRAMREKKRIELWQDALKELRSSIVPDIKGMEKEVFLPLKWSYELLEGKNAKKCFLYCCLFPEDFSIEIDDLISHWIAEGYIDENKLIDSYNKGLALIENLMNSCMLGSGELEKTVKMHDLIRDLAIWIASIPQGCGKFVVQAGVGLTEWPVKKIDPDVGKVSLMQNFINQLPLQTLDYPNMTTLIMHNNPLTGKIPDGFFRDFQSCRVLDLSSTRISFLPISISYLVNLTALYLSDCSCLEELPPLGALKRLQILDLSETGLKDLPDGMEELENLRELNLFDVINLNVVRHGLVPNLHRLEVLNMGSCPYEWGSEITAKGMKATLEELASLNHLTSLDVKIEGLRCLDEAIFSHLWGTLQRFCFLGGANFDLNVPTVTYSTSPSASHEVFIQRVEGVLPRGVKAMLTETDSLVLVECSGMKTLLYFIGIGYMGTLKSLHISSCDQMEELVRAEEVGEEYPLHSLKDLTLGSLPKLKSLWNGVFFEGSLRNLKRVHIEDCPRLKSLFSSGLLQQLRNLEEIFLSLCDGLEEVIIAEEGVMEPDTLPMLRIMRIGHLQSLKNIFPRGLSCPSLREITVIGCQKLKKLPLTHHNAATIQVIEGYKKWWEGLKWEDEHSKSALEPLFRELRI